MLRGIPGYGEDPRSLFRVVRSVKVVFLPSTKIANQSVVPLNAIPTNSHKQITTLSDDFMHPRLPRTLTNVIYYMLICYCSYLTEYLLIY